MTADLPVALRQAIEALLDGVSRKDLGRASSRLSEHYRAGGGSDDAVAGAGDVLPYLVSRLPATYAAISAVLAEITGRAPDFSPASLLDVGAGPGSASWAALEAWPGIESVILFDRNAAFLDMAAHLAEASPHVAMRENRRIRAGMVEIGGEGLEADLIIASYALAEIPESDVEGIALALWEGARGVLMLVEPGTPAGFARIRKARAALLAAGANMVAPCPQGGDCPVVTPDWCHFVQRLPRSRDHRLAKSASLPFEDEKFSYLAVARPGVVVDLPAARVLAPPEMGKAAIGLRLCTPAGIRQETVPRRDREAFARARRLRWGDALEAG